MILVEGPNGKREIASGTRLLPGEKVIGQTDDGKAAISVIVESKIPVGDYIAAFLKPVAIALGKEDCTVCQGKRLVLNFTSELTSKFGVFRASQIIHELWNVAKVGNPSTVAQEIQKYLTNGNGSHTG